MTDLIGQINIANSAGNRTAELESRLRDVKAKQGVIGNLWNGVKEITDLGVSKSDCDSMLDRYKKGIVTYDQALEYINSFEKKQDSTTDLWANIITGVTAIAFATAAAGAGPIGWAFAFAKGAPIGAAVKTLIKFIDRATNNKKNDEFDFKQMSKDAISGAITGTTSAVASQVGIGIKAGKIGLSISNGAKCGAQCGALAGSTSYITDVALDKDKHFNVDDFITNTATSTFISGTVGGIVGAGMYGLSGNVGKDVSKSVSQTIVDDSASSTSRKVLGTMEKDFLAIG